jgi:D-2-hydroxyacid dehydrogenase (NADP+)
MSMHLLLLLPQAENFDHVYERCINVRFPDLRIAWVEHHDQVGPDVASTDILMTFSPFIADHVVRDARRLKWIQVLGSGIDGVINLPSLRKDVLVTNGRGVQATPVSEAAFSLMLALSREMPRMVTNQTACRWQRWPSQVLRGRTVGILGVGQIGEELALKAKAFGMTVVGISSSTRSVNGFDRMVARSRLMEVVSDLDYLVLLTPYSSETHHIVDANVMSRMKPSAFLINVARGGVLNEADLVTALRNGVIRGAALDVFDEEPLPAGHELWSLPNVLISPHLAGLNSSYPESILPLVTHNLSMFLANRVSEMKNIVRAAETRA